MTLTSTADCDCAFDCINFPTHLYELLTAAFAFKLDDAIPKSMLSCVMAAVEVGNVH